MIASYPLEMRIAASPLALVLAALSSGCTLASSDSGADGGAPGMAGSAWEQAILDAHNRYRAEVSVPAIGWSTDAAAHAKPWADHLAQTGTFEHSQAPDRVDEGENLWKGTAGAYSVDAMVAGWGDEKQYFKYGTFPDCSTTGNWQDVGHYTQIIWKDTTNVGCALATGQGWDVLVCRYAPPGNFVGQAPY